MEDEGEFVYLQSPLGVTYNVKLTREEIERSNSGIFKSCINFISPQNKPLRPEGGTLYL